MKHGFEVADIGGRCFTINDRGRTIAIVTSQGCIDWLLRSTNEDGPLLKFILKETHYSHTLGVQMFLTMPTPYTGLRRFSHRLAEDGASVTLIGECESGDGKYTSVTKLTLGMDTNGERYEWKGETTLTNRATEPGELKWIEFNNVYPGKTGRLVLFAKDKEYNCTLLVDRDGTVWRCPHQHLLHYSGKIAALHFNEGTLAGFFGEKHGSVVVVIRRSSFPPDWGICDMYYDLHCGARITRPLQPGETARFEYEIKFLGPQESERLLAASRPVPVTDEDWQRRHYPRLDVGLNRFNRPVNLDRPDEASGFRTEPPKYVWEQQGDQPGRGALRITSTELKEACWSAVPPMPIPSKVRLRIRGQIKTQNVEGRGAFVRVRYHTFVWQPAPPHTEWAKVLESIPVTGTSDGWVTIEVPTLDVPPEHFDYLIWLDFVLEGKGVAWLTDLDMDLQPHIT